MESTVSSSGSTNTAAAAMPSPSFSPENCKVFCSSLFKATNFEFDSSISEEERRFYIKAYPTVDVVCERKTHCTVCKIHIGTAPVQETGIKMHPILRVTHCNKCHDFYNSGEFSKGEDGSELYCRWCGQGGEVYCCSSCPYVFCKSCIVKNLSRGVVADIEQNENWNCFSCAPKILWPLRAQHWALMNYIEHQKKELYAMNLSESELKVNLSKDRSKCCRLAKAKCGNMSDSMESLDSLASKRSHNSSFSAKKPVKHSATPSPQQMNAAKRAKSNDEVVCTPDLLSMLEPDCQITVPPKPNRPMGTPSATTPKIMSIQQPQSGFGAMSSIAKNSTPPPLVLRNTAIKLRPAAPTPVVRRTIIGPRTPTPGGNGTPVYHTINGYRIDLNSAAQHETFRLPNGKLIQVKRQGPPTPPSNNAPSVNNWQQMISPQPQRVIPQTIASRPVQITQHPYNISVQQQQGQHPQVVRYHNNMMGTTTISPVTHNGTTIQVINGQVSSGPHPQQQPTVQQQSGPLRPVMVRHVFPDTAIGKARNGLQDQVFNAMEICTHLTNKVQTLTNSNAYKQARNYLEIKELYIHLSYLLTYAIGRFKSLQDKCLGDMRTLGFGNDADSLENGQLAADKQASDDEDNEIEIVEPKTDLINLDSDDDEPNASTIIKPSQVVAQNKSQPSYLNSKYIADIQIKAGNSPIPTAPAQATTPDPHTLPEIEDNMDLMSMAQSFLASMLEVEIQEGPFNSPGSDSSGQKKQPRKKLTNKPNPTLLKQKALMERERLEELKRNDQKLKMKCSVELKKAEEVFPYAKEMLEARAKEKLDLEEAMATENHEEVTSTGTDEEDKANEITNKENETLNGLTEEKNKSTEEKNESIISNTEEKEEDTDASLNATEKIAENLTSDKTSENENSIEAVDKSAADSKQDEETKSCNGKEMEEIEEKLNNSVSTTSTEEKLVNKENDVANSLDENSQKMDIEKNNSNNSTKEDIEPEAMETDENPLDTDKDEAMEELNEKESPEENNVPISLKKAEEAKTELMELEPETETILPTQDDKTEINSAMDDKNNELNLEADEEKCELTLSPMREEHPVMSDKENDKNINDDKLPQSEEDKDSTTLLEELPRSKEPTTNTSLTDIKESSSNGNV